MMIINTWKKSEGVEEVFEGKKEVSKGNSSDNEILLDVKDLVKHFRITTGIIFSRKAGSVQAVDRVSFSIKKGETLGLVGESGCGKSTIARLILRLIEADSGKVYFEDKDILKIPWEEIGVLRRNMQIIFQDPYGSLNPRMTVGNIIGEPLEIHNIGAPSEREKRKKELLEVVGLNPILDVKRYPHEFSGGQRQRIGIARALALNPKLIICDEPVSSLDVSIRAQVINLLQDLQRKFGLTYLFISHDLSVVKHISKRVAIMYLGKTVELGEKNEIYDKPQHPYTEALLLAIPIPDPTVARKVILEGDVPSPINPPSGCRFHTRCLYVTDICRVEEPQFIDIGGGHYVACHLRKA